MVDAFPSHASDPDRQIQLRIDADLENAQSLQEAFETAFPVGSVDKMMALIDRMRNRPKEDALYPRLTAALERSEWLTPLVRRFLWNRSHGEKGAPWPALLSVMLRITLAKVRVASEAEFLALVETGQGMVELRSFGYLEFMAEGLRRLEKAGPLSPEVVDAARKLLQFCDHPHTATNNEIFVWPFFRSATAFDSADPCWSARVRRDLASVEPKLRVNWLLAFDGDPRRRSGSAAFPSRSCLAAVKRLGNAQLEAGLRRWISMLGDHPGAVLSPIGVIVFRHVLVLCDFLGGSVSDELLYDVARAPWVDQPSANPWGDKPHLRWMDTYLWALGRRSEDRAFACLEALMMNPATAIEPVRKQYDALLAVFGAGALPAASIGVDGFRLDSDPALQSQQTRIDQLLRMAADAASKGPYTDPGVGAHLQYLRSMKEEAKSPAVKAWEARMTRPLPWFPVAPEVTAAIEVMEAAILKEFSADPASLHRAVVTRLDWVAAHKQEYPEGAFQLWNQLFRGLGCDGGLLQRSLRQVEELPLGSLLDTVRTSRGAGKVFDLCREYVAKHGWNTDLVEAFRQWIPRIGTASGDLSYRARAEWFLWSEDVAPIQLDACWSHRVKQDLREVKPGESAAWRAMFGNSCFMITGKPPKKWLKAGEAAFRKLGHDKFRRRFLVWFAPFSKGESLRLTVTGRNLLRLLLWYALIAQDPVVDEALLGFAKARWKTKESANRAAQAEMAFSHVLAQRAPEKALSILENLVASGQAFEGSTTHSIYMELCGRFERTPAAAIPAESSPRTPPAPNPLLDTLTVGDLQRALRTKLT